MPTLSRHHRACDTVGRYGLTMIELLVAMALMTMLAILLIPAIYAARQSTQRAQCQSNLRMIGVALLAHQNAKMHFPAGRDAASGHQHSWATAILPELEEQGLFDRYDWAKPWDDEEGNLEIEETEVPVYRCPTSSNNNREPGATDYGGNYGSSLTGLPRGFELNHAWDSGVLLLLNDEGVDPGRKKFIRLSDVRDGANHTFMVLEDAGRLAKEGGLWANGHQCFAHDEERVNVNRSNEIYSDHLGGANALLVSGAVRFLSNDTHALVLGAMCTRANHDQTAVAALGDM